MADKKNILFYSGHCEIVGGDAKYIFELISNLNSDKYNIKVYTDINPILEKRSGQWLSKNISVHYLDTRPRLFNNRNNALNVFQTIQQSSPEKKNVKIIFNHY